MTKAIEDDERCTHVGAFGYDRNCIVLCECGRDTYCSNDYTSCYECFLDRRAEYIDCIYCGQWHSPQFDTCYNCRPGGRDEAAAELKLTILARDKFACRYCSAREGDLQIDPRLVRPKCTSRCAIQHNHKSACKPKCVKRHRHLTEDDPRLCAPWCITPHVHLAQDDHGVRPAKLHIDHIKPCAKQGTADPWNLQSLCGVCNISKGSDWWGGSRHDLARKLMVSAYMTYLWAFLSSDEKESLTVDAEEYKLTLASALSMVTADYINRVKACRPRPAPAHDLVVEDPPDMPWLSQ